MSDRLIASPFGTSLSIFGSFRQQLALVGDPLSEDGVSQPPVRRHLAQDADLLLTKRVVDRCYDMEIPCTQVESMEKLGRACGIDVKAAAAGLLK